MIKPVTLRFQRYFEGSLQYFKMQSFYIPVEFFCVTNCVIFHFITLKSFSVILIRLTFIIRAVISKTHNSRFPVQWIEVIPVVSANHTIPAVWYRSRSQSAFVIRKPTTRR